MLGMGGAQKSGLQELNGVYKKTDDLYHEAALAIGLSDVESGEGAGQAYFLTASGQKLIREKFGPWLRP